MGCHFSEVQKLVHTDRKSDTFPEHYVKHMGSDNPSVRDIRMIYKFEILWEGNPINLTKAFGIRNRSLHLQRKFFNEISEIEGVYMHKITLHRLQEGINYTVATDEHTIVWKKVFWWKTSMQILYICAKVRAYHLCHTCFRFVTGF